MFKKRTTETEMPQTERSEKGSKADSKQGAAGKTKDRKKDDGRINTILKGSKLTGDINVSCDLELSGDVEGNISSNEESRISIKGTCKGNIEGGNINIEGELLGGNITAGKDVRISGKFSGGEIKANGKIHVNGDFKGKLEANEIEIGSEARGEGELFYREYISIAKGARLEAKVSQAKQELKLVTESPGKESMDAKSIEKEAKEAKESNNV